MLNEPVNWTDPDGREPQTYPAPDREKPIREYNCAGLAFRDYKYWNDRGDVERILAQFTKLSDCNKQCNKCQIKFCYWTFLVGATAKPNPKPEDVLAFVANFHIVGGQANCDNGSDPTEWYSKNGKDPIEGPQKRCEDFEPSDKEVVPLTIGGDKHTRTRFRKDKVKTCYCADLDQLAKLEELRKQPEPGAK